MEEDEVPKLMSFAFVHVEETARQRDLRESYNWKITPGGWLRMDKKPPSTPPKNLPPLEFAGQCFDEDENVWTSCFEIEKDGSIASNDTSFHKVRSAAGNVELDLDKALGLVADASKAAGVIFIYCENQTTRLSGFFITDRFFLTCAHFEVTAIVEELIKKSGSKRTQIRTDTKLLGNGTSAHLVFRDEVRDFAIFCLDEDQQPHTSHFDLDRNFPGIDRLDFRTELASRGAFTIGYNSNHNFEDFPYARKQVINNLTPEKKARAENTPTTPVYFHQVFLPDRKSLSIGRLDSDPPSKGETKWKHRITGWYGMSGAMIACLDKSSTLDAKVQVLGLFSRGSGGNNNQMVMLTTEILRDIRDVIRSHTSNTALESVDNKSAKTASSLALVLEPLKSLVSEEVKKFSANDVAKGICEFPDGTIPIDQIQEL
ncbi:hypothetical protein EPUS_00065 [Endocarpon pusillum Z07020]|uniref:Uncharacterized protein n=1 Tax=Endocarpon pusillum (strain Z07020 / HMAS-L-300199) TaxID=1263415 RepID=U1GSC1_ENDPU|nr:uncharacterized protein EPUS_00065 [Endocarpon pusillum Z07020]ERF75273.1 hypothetical protein EPUS_00065 [Endocarpon pusillum Z07020]